MKASPPVYPGGYPGTGNAVVQPPARPGHGADQLATNIAHNCKTLLPAVLANRLADERAMRRSARTGHKYIACGTPTPLNILNCRIACTLVFPTELSAGWVWAVARRLLGPPVVAYPRMTAPLPDTLVVTCAGLPA
jgi:hypothetical protein